MPCTPCPLVPLLDHGHPEFPYDTTKHLFLEDKSRSIPQNPTTSYVLSTPDRPWPIPPHSPGCGSPRPRTGETALHTVRPRRVNGSGFCFSSAGNPCSTNNPTECYISPEFRKATAMAIHYKKHIQIIQSLRPYIGCIPTWSTIGGTP